MPTVMTDITTIRVTDTRKDEEVITAHAGQEDIGGSSLIEVRNANITQGTTPPKKGDKGYHISYTDVHGYHKNATGMRCHKVEGHTYSFMKP